MSQPIAATEPMPCPCGSDLATVLKRRPPAGGKGGQIVSRFSVWSYAVSCMDCGTTGPEKDNETEAVEAWNALCSAEQRGYERGVRECVEIVHEMWNESIADGESHEANCRAFMIRNRLRSLLPDNPTKANADQA